MTKRGSDDLSMDEVNGSESPDDKKAKLNNNNNNNVGSRVVHVRNVPLDANETDLFHLSLPFGRVTNVLLLRGKSQGFVEFESFQSASQMVSYWLSSGTNQLQPTVRGRHVFCQLSNHKELKIAVADANCVLRVVVENLLYPVSLDVLHSVFARAGKVLKMVTFTKNGAFQALVQFESHACAVAAKTLLDGQNLFNCACTLRIEFSKLQQLNVKYNNDKSRDFTNPALPGDFEPLALALPFAQFARVPLVQQPTMGSVLLVSNLNEESITPDALFTLFGVYGDVMRVKILFNKKDNALVQMAEPTQAHLALTYLDKVKLFGRVMRVAHSKHQSVQMPKEGQHDAGLTKDFSTSPLHRFKKKGSKNYANIYPPSATLHLSNIPACASEEDIKAAFSACTCNIVAFKFFPKDRKMALIQLSSSEDAIGALIAMHNHQLAENAHLRVSFSKSAI